MFHALQRSLAAAALATSALLTVAHPACAADSHQTYVSHGMIRITKGCSASLVRFPDFTDNQPALVLTNAHCNDVIPEPGKYLQEAAYPFDLELTTGERGSALPVHADRVAVASITGTDAAFIRLTETYADLRARYGAVAEPYTVSERPAEAGAPIVMFSGYWNAVTSCMAEAVVPAVWEGDWAWRDSVRYSRCQTRGGWSGSPIVDPRTSLVVGVHNTATTKPVVNCGYNNPCEVDAQGVPTAQVGRRYGQQVAEFGRCFDAATRFQPKAASCRALEWMGVTPNDTTGGELRSERTGGPLVITEDAR